MPKMKKLCAKAGVQPTKVFPHNLRHLFAATFYRVTHDIVKLADVLGHSSINTTRIYLLTTGTEHSRQLKCLGLVQ
jgi:site-specific recombinase XerD